MILQFTNQLDGVLKLNIQFFEASVNSTVVESSTLKFTRIQRRTTSTEDAAPTVPEVYNFDILVQSVDFGMLRGVSPNVAAFYNPSKDFTCFDGLFRIPFNYVNDDYCDCLDGSDEPGTSACENGSFHCVNPGYMELKIFSSRVNDGICDCCDGSDEWLTSHCDNTCGVLSEAARAQAMDHAILLSKGHNLRQQMIHAAGEMRLHKEERLRKLVEEKLHAEKLKEAAEVQKNWAEEAEKAALHVYRDAEERAKRAKFRKETREDATKAHNVFINLDSNHNDLLELEEIKVKHTFDRNKDGKVSDDEVIWYSDLQTNEVSEQVFQDSIWPHIKHLFSKMERENHEEVQNGREENEDIEEEDEEPSYDSRTRKLIEEANEARSQYEHSKSVLENVQHEVNQLKVKLDMDYGPEEEYATLDGQCFSYTDRDYTYTLCPFVQVTQAPKSGGSETLLGHWGHWLTGESSSAMVYDKGQSCWKGPQRSTVVILECGTDNTITSVSEPNKCEYQIHFKTPAACHTGGSHEHLDHEEL